MTSSTVTEKRVRVELFVGSDQTLLKHLEASQVPLDKEALDRDPLVRAIRHMAENTPLPTHPALRAMIGYPAVEEKQDV